MVKGRGKSQGMKKPRPFVERSGRKFVAKERDFVTNNDSIVLFLLIIVVSSKKQCIFAKKLVSDTAYRIKVIGDDIFDNA